MDLQRPGNVHLKFENGWTVSIAFDKYAYAGPDTVEIAAWPSGGDFHRFKGWTDDVRGWFPVIELPEFLAMVERKR